MCGDTICGGSSSSTTSSCLRLSPNATFLQTNSSLVSPRYKHSCLASDLGVLLLGGHSTHATTTELVRPDGSSASSFTLRHGHHVHQACAIYLAATVVLSGGKGAELKAQAKVAQYSGQGWLRDLPDLNIDRFSHACSSYSDTNTGVQVTGYSSLSTLEMFLRCWW